MINFLHTYTPDPILATIGPISIYWYSVMITLAVLIAFLVLFKLSKKFSVSFDQLIDLLFYVVIFGIIGARIYHVLIQIDYYWQHPFEIIKVWQGGMAIHGAIIAGIIITIIFAKKKKQSFWFWADLSAPVVALGQAIGRWGNYFNQEVFGKPTSLPWGIPIEWQNRIAPYFTQEYFHPTFLYESMLNFINFLILTYLLLKKPKSNKPGNIFLIYLISYSVIRFSMEFIRTDPTWEILGLRFPQIVSMIIILISAGIIFKRGKVAPVKK